MRGITSRAPPFKEQRTAVLIGDACLLSSMTGTPASSTASGSPAAGYTPPKGRCAGIIKDASNPHKDLHAHTRSRAHSLARTHARTHARTQEIDEKTSRDGLPEVPMTSMQSDSGDRPLHACTAHRFNQVSPQSFPSAVLLPWVGRARRAAGVASSP